MRSNLARPIMKSQSIQSLRCLPGQAAEVATYMDRYRPITPARNVRRRRASREMSRVKGIDAFCVAPRTLTDGAGPRGRRRPLQG